MLAAVGRTQRAFPGDGQTPERRTTYRSRESIEGLFVRDGLTSVRTELLEVHAEYAGFDEFWSALADGAGPAGVWVKSLGEERLGEAREEMYRQLDSPAGGFGLTGRAWATRATRA